MTEPEPADDPVVKEAFERMKKVLEEKIPDRNKSEVPLEPKKPRK
jgi:hypothetical protein